MSETTRPSSFQWQVEQILISKPNFIEELLQEFIYRVFKWNHLHVQTSFETKEAIGHIVKTTASSDAVNDPAINDHQVCHCPAHHKVVLRFVVFGPYLFSGHVAQTGMALATASATFTFLSMESIRVKMNSQGKHDGQRNARKTAAGTQVQHLAARLGSMNLATERNAEHGAHRGYQCPVWKQH